MIKLNGGLNVLKQKPEFCRDCINFVERRDLEGFAACIRNHRPRVACQDFTPIKDSPEFVKNYAGFCLYCDNLVIVDGFTVCARNHRPRIACQDFMDVVSTLMKRTSMKRVRIAEKLLS
jgi:uncharacterized protein YbdZ (MbtH family)